jgi:hypothetical protein
MSLHSLAYTPDFPDIGVAQRPVAFELIAQIHDAAGLVKQTFRCVIREFGQCFCTRNADAYWNAGVLENGRSELAAKRSEIAWHTCQISKGFIN